MSECIITRRGGSGGLSPNNAVIHVTASVGSTISFSKGGVVAKVLGPEKSHVNAEDNTLADWYYPVSYANYGEWTATATLGTETASDTVIVESNKQYDLELSYTYYLYNNGNECVAITGGWTAAVKNASAAVAEKGHTFIQLAGIPNTTRDNRRATCYTNNAISLTDFSTIKVLYEAWNPAPAGSSDPFGEFKFGEAAQSSSFTSYNMSNIQGTSITSVTSETTLSFDISILAGNFYIGGMIYMAGVKIYKVWLE